MGTKFKTGDLVWAKMKGFSPWPAQVVEPNEKLKRPTMKKPMYCVFFYGTKNYAWVLEDLVMPYQECKEKYLKNNKAGSFKEAVEAIEEYIRTHPQGASGSQDTADKDLLPTIEEEIAAICPNDSSKSPLKESPKSSLKKKIKVADRANKSKQKAIKTLIARKDSPRKRKPENDVEASKVKKGCYDLKRSPSLARSLTPPSYSHSYTNSSPKPAGLLSRPAPVARPPTPPLDLDHISETLKKKNVVASQLKFGFLGLGIMGRGIVKNLLHSGHQVTIWNRTPSKCNDFLKVGAVKGQTPADVVAASDITFSCVSDPEVAKEIVFGNCGVLQEIRASKGYVEMTSLDPQTSNDISDGILNRGGRYLEAQMVGSKDAAEDGSLIVLTAGDRSLFNECTSCFQVIGRHCYYLGVVGAAAKMSLMLHSILGATLASMAEAISLADRVGVSHKDLLEVLELGILDPLKLIEKGKAMMDSSLGTKMPLRHMQKDLSLALNLGEKMGQPLPLMAAANEMYKHAKQLGYADHDVSAIYLGVRF